MISIFESIKKMDDAEQEYWSARELYKILGYTEYGKFLPAIKRAILSCETSEESPENHFAQVSDMIKIAVGTVKETSRKVENYKLSRYACYLIAQNGDPKKPEIAEAQKYFAFQTRRHEIDQSYLEDVNRIKLRGDATEQNKKLAEAAEKAGVKRYGEFQNAGYEGLYNGMTAEDIHAKKGLKKSQKILDHMGSEELGANVFRATQTAAKLKRENIFGQKNASATHKEVGQTIRKTIAELGGTMPEELPASDGIVKAKTRVEKIGEHL